MPVIHTHSATPLEAVTLERGRAGTTHVWLRKNIIQTTVLFKGEAQDAWEADEVYFHTGAPVTTGYVQENFEALWTREAYRVEPPTVEAVLQDLCLAVGELGAIVAGGAL